MGSYYPCDLAVKFCYHGVEFFILHPLKPILMEATFEGEIVCVALASFSLWMHVSAYSGQNWMYLGPAGLKMPFPAKRAG